MKTKSSILAAAACALLSGSPAHANKGHELLEKMPDPERNTALLRHMKASHGDCDLVVKNFFQGFDKNKIAYWNVECRNKKSYLVMINNDTLGSSQILNCNALKMMKARTCFTKF
jgi:hypothetical protein